MSRTVFGGHAPVARLPKHLVVTLVLGCLVTVGGCGGCGPRATTTGSAGGTTSAEGATAAPTATATATSASASASAPTATTSTSAPTHVAATATHAPPAQPTATKAPTPPNIAGSYGGYYSKNATFGEMPLLLQISQSGSSLFGSSTEKEGSVVTADTGSIALNGSFTITEKQGGAVYGMLVGSITGPGHLSGTWNDGGATLGTWVVNNPPVSVNLYGTYSGTYTTAGSTGTNPMTLSLSQSGFTLTGTTTEGSATYTDTGVLEPNGSLTINEGGPVLTGGITDYGQLSGTWTSSGGTVHGAWIVNVLLI